MANAVITLINRTPATVEWLLSLGLSPAIVENIKDVQVQLEDVDTSSLMGDARAQSEKINNLKENI